MKPTPGTIYAGKSGKPRKVVRLEREQSYGSPPFGYSTYDVIYKSVLGPRRYGKERRCWCTTWEAWVRGPIQEHQA